MIKRLVKKYLKRYYKKQGFYGDFGMLWFYEAISEFRKSSLPASKKIWAIKRGFYPYRIEQYGLTEENYKEILSDRDFWRIYPINNTYANYLDEKVLLKYILRPFDEYMPKYYYHILKSRPCQFLKLMDCEESSTCDVDGVMKILRQVGKLAFKPVRSTHGNGFFAVFYDNGEYQINGKNKSETEIKEFINSIDDYIITEYVEMHEIIRKINPNSLNTIRVSVINKTGNDPIIPTAFMRLGTKKSGFVDNTAQGGMFCKVDVENGRFYGAETCVDHVISPVKTHPDTNEVIEGIIPGWNLVKEKLIEISAYFPQVEWIGFDIAITEDGFKIIEANPHQGIHRYPTYPQVVKDYFMEKVQEKEEKQKCSKR